jgi:hypothetical protein
MASLPRPLLALLVATVAAFALWTVALKPGSSTGGSANSPTAPVYQSAIAKAHQAAAASDRASAADGAPVTSTAAPATHPTAPATHPTAPARHPAAAATHPTSLPTTQHHATQHHATKAKSHPAVSQKSVLAAIASHKVVALLFYNPAAADDAAVAHELTGVSTDHGQVATFAVPVSRISQFGAITAKVQVDATPTLFLIDKHGQATSLVGFSDRFEIAQRVSQALRAK